MVFLFAIVMAMILLVFGNSIQRVLAEHMQLFAHASDLLFRLRGLWMIGIMSCIFAVIYKALPNRKVLKARKLTLRNQFPGALLCAVAWYIFSFGISVYVDYFNGFSMYGSLTTIVLLMLWLYFGMYITFVCAEINVWIYRDTL